MDKYIDQMLAVARAIGSVKTIEMAEAGTYLPSRMEIKGVTPTGEMFELELKVGEPKRDDS